tara:strand:- start:382 stop:615 length:234 start_codon:yes stop_codon:yes gene_type:complete
MGRKGMVDMPWARKEFMSKQKLNAKAGATSIRILVNHGRWLEANGYKQQAASCKRQAASLTRQEYRIIREYENRRSI